MGIPVLIPYVAGNDVTAEGQNANEAAMAAEIVNIQDVNVPVGAAIQGSKIANAPNGIGTAQLNNGAVTQTKLALASVSLDKMLLFRQVVNISLVFSGTGGSNNNLVSPPTPIPILTYDIIAIFFSSAISLNIGDIMKGFSLGRATSGLNHVINIVTNGTESGFARTMTTTVDIVYMQKV